MRQSILILLATVLVAASGKAQENATPSLQGSVFLSAVKPASADNKSLQLGGGLEAELPRGFAAGVELGHIYSDQKGTGLFSVNGSYRFRGLEWIEPSVTAGYSLPFQDPSTNLFHFGVGATRWMNDHAGFRMEVRDYVATAPSPNWPRNTLEYRFSVVFR